MKRMNMASLRLLHRNKFIFSCSKQRQINNHGSRAKSHSKTSSSADSEVVLNFSNGKHMILSTGKYARLADGCAVATLGDTSVMVTTVSKSQSSGVNSFLPLVVDYRQKAAAAGRIPTNFFRRELGHTEHEILTSRLIDRSLRPLFPQKYNYETQVVCNMLALDGNNDPDVLSINGASAALAVSDIPWNGPVGENLVVMLEGSADNILVPELRKALKAGVKECQIIVQSIQKLQKNFGKPKRTVEPPAELPEEIVESIKSLSEKKLRKIFSDYKHDKLSRDNAINNLRNEVLTTVKASHSELDSGLTLEAFSEFSKTLFRSLIFENNCRCDGRKYTDLRNITCQVDLFKPLHGSALFQRGQTQVLCTVTLDSPDSAHTLLMKLDVLVH